MASALENYVNSVRVLSAAGKYRELADLHQTETVDLLTRNWNILDNVLETLDMQQHSLGVLFVLIAKFKSVANSNPEPTHLVNLVKNFVQECNTEHVRCALNAYYELFHMFTAYIVDKPVRVHGIKILGNAIEKIRLADAQLTPIHADVCLISLKSFNMKVALEFLDVDITSISMSSEPRGASTDTNNDAKYFLLYYYYGGMIYTRMQDLERALYFFEACISIPAMAMSHIMLEAYKKFILVSLILHGKVIILPKYSTQAVSRFLKPLAQIYHDLANAYASSSTEDLRVVINKYSEMYTRDTNMGLVKQVLKSLTKKNIQRLTKTFLTLSLSDVASRVSLNSAKLAEKYIFNMIISGEIYATINQKDGMVVFKDDPEKYNSPEMFEKIQTDMSRVMDLVKQVNGMETEIQLNPMYIKKVIGNQEDETNSQHAKTFSGDPTD